MSSSSNAASAPATPAVESLHPEVGLQRRRLIYGCILLTVFLAAMEGTIAATAMPAIVADLGGFELYSWIFSGYLVVQAATTVIMGKLADLYGRRTVMVASILIFVLASVFAGFAWSMPVLILARVLQGFGSGGIQPIASAMIADLYNPAERAKLQGFTSSMWGIASVIAPLLGGFLVLHLSWSWIFWINVILGLPPMIGFWLLYPAHLAHRSHRIDYLGAALFAVSIGSLIVVLVQGGTTWPWMSVPVAGLLALFLVTLVLFLMQERRASEPIVALDLWRDPRLAINNSTILLLGMTLIGLSLLLPLYIQGVLGGSAVEGGLPLTALGIAWPLASVLFAWLARAFDRHLVRFGAAVFLCGTIGLLFLGEHTSLYLTLAIAAVMGFGMGVIATSSIVLIQGSFDWSRRASALASNVFARLIGTSIGAAVLGGILNSGLRAHLAAEHRTGGTIDLRSLLDHVGSGGADLRAALSSGIHGAAITVVVLAFVAFCCAQFIRVTPAALGLDRR